MAEDVFEQSATLLCPRLTLALHVLRYQPFNQNSFILEDDSRTPCRVCQVNGKTTLIVDTLAVLTEDQSQLQPLSYL